MICRLPIARQTVLLGRTRRAVRAWVSKRISIDTFDSILARINSEMESAQ